MMKFKTYTEGDEALKGWGYEAKGQDGKLNHVYERGSSRVLLGHSVTGGYEARLMPAEIQIVHIG